MRRMRVAVFQPLVPTYRVALFEQLSNLPGVDIKVYAGGDMGSLRHVESGARFTCARAPVRSLPFDIRVQLAQATVTLRQPLDLLILPWDVRYLSIAPAIAIARCRGIPVILWGHGYSKRPHILTDAIRDGFGKLADAVLLYSRSIADNLVAERGFQPERVFVAPNSLEQYPISAARQYWLDNSVALQEFQREHRIDTRFTIAFVSRLEAGNHVDLLLRGLAKLRAVVPQARLLIVGEGSDEARLRQVAESLEVHGHTTFVGREYDERRLARWLMSATLMCYPSNMGLSLLHAFGYGLPVVTSDNLSGHGPEIEALEHGTNGLLFRTADVEGMVDRWLEILNSPGLRQSLSAGALATVSTRYSMTKMVEGFGALFGWARSYRHNRVDAKGHA